MNGGSSWKKPLPFPAESGLAASVRPTAGVRAHMWPVGRQGGGVGRANDPAGGGVSQTVGCETPEGDPAADHDARGGYAALRVASRAARAARARVPAMRRRAVSVSRTN